MRGLVSVRVFSIQGGGYIAYGITQILSKTQHVRGVRSTIVIHYVTRRFFIQLFRQRLSHKSVKAYATMPIGIMGSKSLALLD